MPDRPSGRKALRGGDDRARVDAMRPVEIGDRARLPEMFDAERARAMTPTPPSHASALASARRKSVSNCKTKFACSRKSLLKIA